MSKKPKINKDGYYEVPKEDLPPGVLYRMVLGKKPPKKKGESANINKITYLVEPRGYGLH